MGYDTKTLIKKMIIDVASQPKDVWVGTNLVKAIYVGTTMVWNNTVYVCPVSSWATPFRNDKMSYSAKLGSSSSSGSFTSSTWNTSTYAHPASVNGQQLGGYGLDVGYGAQVTWTIDGIKSGYGAFSRDSTSVTITYSGSTVNKTGNAYLYSQFDPVRTWGIRTVQEKSFSNIRPFTSSGALNPNNFWDGSYAEASGSTRWWPDSNTEDWIGDQWWSTDSSNEVEIDIPSGSKGYTEIQLRGLKVCNIGSGKSIPYRIYYWSDTTYYIYLDGTAQSRTTDNGMTLSVTLGNSVTYGSWGHDGFDRDVRDVWVDDDGNVYIDVDISFSFSSGGSHASEAGECGALYSGPYHSGKSDNINTFLYNLVISGSVYYG